MLVKYIFSIIFILGSIEMHDREIIAEVKDKIKISTDELNDIAVQLGGVFLDEQLKLDNCSIISEIDSLEKDIPRIKSEMDSLQKSHQVVQESRDKLDECNSIIKGYDEDIDSILEKLGIELFSAVGEFDLEVPEFNSIYKMIKEGESRSETLETKLYKEENSVANRGLIHKVFVPFKIKHIKNKISNNSKENLRKFRDLGRVFTESPRLIENESRVSILGIFEEYQSVNKLKLSQLDKRKALNQSINDHKKMIEDGSKGLKLSNLYTKLEKEIVECQNNITLKLGELGHFLMNNEDLSGIDNKEVIHKIDLYRNKKKEIDENEEVIDFYRKRIQSSELKSKLKNLENGIEAEENKIKEMRKKLTKKKKDMSLLVDELNELDKWIEANGSNFEA